ncbi:MAG TPA: UDP-N-acetylmuramoyl-tripeptide--D-alanyl-D-alanine ligase [Thiothrix sp.]|nr:UDP-N-acetylmuramoyl-tripeptide--D-alanyl-D-alanine ligase [Thiothrix sp.]
MADYLDGELINVPIGNPVIVDSLSTDSRHIQANQLFWALKGERFDAHDFVVNLASNDPHIPHKAAAALVHRPIDCALPQIVVSDTYQALATLARRWREQFNKPVIALTGSNGKTTLKEMLAAILSQQGQVMATAGNFNNEIGMPLTLLRLRDADDYAVIEMGANHFGEIAYLTDIAQPDVAIVNNAGAAHLEGFGSIKGVSRAKGEIFQGLSSNKTHKTQKGIAIINADDQYADYWRSINTEHEIITFGMDHPADVHGELQADGSLQIMLPKQQTVVVQLPLLGQHNALNALAASAAAIAVNASLASIKQGLESLQAVKGRLAPIKGQNNSTLIDDTYNANPSSIEKAIDVLAARQGRRVLVLGDVAEIGDNGEQLHREIGEYAAQAHIDVLYGFGEAIQATCEAFQQAGKESHFFSEMPLLLKALQIEIQPNTTLLAKGSRSMKMERVIAAFENKSASANKEEGAC